jgi:hypothetical protein
LGDVPGRLADGQAIAFLWLWLGVGGHRGLPLIKVHIRLYKRIYAYVNPTEDFDMAEEPGNG